MQVLVEGINALGRMRNMQQAKENPKAIRHYLAPGRKLADFANEFYDRELTAGEQRYLEAWPDAINEAVRAAMISAAERGQRIQVQWIPAYDFEVHIWEPRSDSGSLGGVVIQFGSPYPSDVLGKSGGTRSATKVVNKKIGARRKATVRPKSAARKKATGRRTR